MYSNKEAKLLLENLILLQDFDWKLFLHRVCDQLCNRLNLIELYALYPREICERPVSNYVFTCRNLIKNVLKNEVESEAYELDETLEQVLRERKSELLQALKEEVILSGEAALSDFDWSVRLVLGSDTMSSIRKPVCQLQLRIDRPCERRESPEISCIELSSNELDCLIESLDNALTSCEKLSA